MKPSRLLKRGELERVKPKFRALVEAAWANGEDVPYGVVYLDDREPTEMERVIGLEIAKRWEQRKAPPVDSTSANDSTYEYRLGSTTAS